jgi:hypothetical protein
MRRLHVASRLVFHACDGFLFGPPSSSRLQSLALYSFLGPALALPDLTNYIHCSVGRRHDGTVRLLGLGSTAPFLHPWGGTWMWDMSVEIKGSFPYVIEAICSDRTKWVTNGSFNHVTVYQRT